MRYLIVFMVAGLFAGPVLGASKRPEVRERWLTENWPAWWITHPKAPKNEFGVWLFRKTFELAAKPEKFVVHVTGDARYRLFVNGRSVTYGPQRSDQWVCHFETVDLGPWLEAGENTIAARVWNYGDLTPYSIVSVRTGFLLQGDGELESAVDTNATWKVTQDPSYAPVPVVLPTYIVVGPGQRIDGATHPWGWETKDFDDAEWSVARTLMRGMPWSWGTDMSRWLRPRNIPLMEETRTEFARVRRSEGIEAAGTSFTVPARTKATVLFDHAVETNAFPQLVVSGGAGAKVKLTYAEALIDASRNKGHRDEVEGRRAVGVSDEFIADGGERRTFSSLDFRTYRYVQVEIETGAEPLRVEEFFGMFTGYPFQERGAFASDDAELEKIWDVGWRTARLCAQETYVDCPYYEQLQYVGDTRLQALISLYVAGDDRLMRNAIEQYDRSRIAEGLTQSRYPSVTPQLINTFSLFWADMVHDYWRHRTDDAFVRARLAGVDAVLGWFDRKMDRATGLLGPLEYWTFVDWADEWKWDQRLGAGGEPEGARTGGSSIVSLQLAGTLARTAELWRALGDAHQANEYERRAAGLKAAVVKLCWDEERRLFADSPAKRQFSQHANALAVLTGAIEGEAATDLMRRVIGDEELIQCSTYFRFYLLRAMKTAGLGDEYLAQLGPWRTMLARGLTTFAEKLDPTRSDCHAWSATPIYEFLATVLGVEPATPGFATVRIAPHPGKLRRAEGVVPHPRGEIKVALRRERADGVTAEVTLPDGVTGEFVWKGTRVALHAGSQTVEVE